MAESDRVYLVETTKGTRRITVPQGYKITYGPLINFKPTYGGHEKVAVALRVYRTEKDCIALFRDVLSFREIGPITVEIMDVNEQGVEEWTEDNRGVIERRQQREEDVLNVLTDKPRDASAYLAGTKITFPYVSNLTPNVSFDELDDE